MDKKLKVVWLCRFINKNILSYFGNPKLNDNAPWITQGIEAMKKRSDVELHIVAPQWWSLKSYTTFTEKNVHYHFFKVGVPFFKRNWPSFFRFDCWTNYSFNRAEIKKHVKNIKPDIINLHGCENPQHASAILDLVDSYPTFLTVQGFVGLDGGAPNRLTRKRIHFENRILREVNNIGIETTSMKEHIESFNKNANLFWFHYPVTKPSSNSYQDVQKTYDLVYFARVCKEKGIEDLLDCIHIIKEKMPSISLKVIGGVSSEYLDLLKIKCQELHISQNVEFLGFLPTHNDIFKVASAARVSVLPTYNDTIPGTIIESMSLKLPMVSYKTGGVPDLNREDEHLVLLDQGDVHGMAGKIMDLLNDQELSNQLAEKAYAYAMDEFDNDKAVDKMMGAYRSILNIQ